MKEKEHNRKIAIYGIGIETKKALPNLISQYNVIGLLDSFMTEGNIYGQPIISIEKAISEGISLIIVVARPGSCKAITKRIANICVFNNIELYDLVTVGELENFEDKNGNGSYRASYGHDDLIMTFVQIPMLKQTAKYKDIMEEYEAANVASNAPGYMNNFDYSALQTNMVVTQTPIFNNNPFGSLYPGNPMSSLYPNR